MRRKRCLRSCDIPIIFAPNHSSRSAPPVTTIAGVRNSLHGAENIEDRSLSKHRPSVSGDAGLFGTSGAAYGGLEKASAKRTEDTGTDHARGQSKESDDVSRG